MVRSIGVDDKALEGTGDYQPIPEGTKLKVSIFEIKEGVTGPNSKNPGKPQFEYTAKVTEDGEFKGRELRYNYVPLFAGATNGWVLTAFAEAVGWKIDKDTKTVEVPDDLTEVLGTEVIAKIGQRESQKINPNTNKPYINNTVTGVRKIRSGGGGITEPSEKKGWDSL